VAEETLAFDKTELRQLYKAFKVLGDEAKDEARQQSNALASFLQTEIRQAGYQRTKGAQVIRRIVDGSRVKKSSTTGEITYGFASQRFSGGANTKDLWTGYEFGSSRYKQFPSYSGRLGRGSRGWFIYPTLRKNQNNIVGQWTAAFNRILDKWGINGI
jgi:hypothetical protein